MSHTALLDLCGLRDGRRIIFMLDADMTILDLSDQALRIFPDLRIGVSFFASFEFLRPRRVSSPADILAHGDELILATPVHGHCAIRGSLIKTGTADKQLMFIGAPWLNWMREHRPDIALGFEDFDTADSQLDMLFVLASERRNMADLDALAKELELTRQQLLASTGENSERIKSIHADLETHAHELLHVLRSMDPKAPASDLINQGKSSASQIISLLKQT